MYNQLVRLTGYLVEVWADGMGYDGLRLDESEKRMAIRVWALGNGVGFRVVL